MVKIPLDFRFVEIGAELEALSDHLATIEEQLRYLKDQRKTQKFGALRERGEEDDDGAVSLAFHELQIHEHVYSKAFRGGFLVTLWAVYESGVHEVARFLQDRKGKVLKLSDLRGSNVLDRCRKYFDHVLEFELHPTDTDWSVLEDLYAIRNGLAHANGRLMAMNAATRRAVEGVIDKGVGVQSALGDILVDETFLHRTFETVDVLLRDLIERARELDDRTRTGK